MSDERKILESSIKDHQAAIDKAKKDLEALEETYSVGDRFKNKNGRKYIIIAVADVNTARVMFSDLKTGHGSGIDVENWSRITADELRWKLTDFTRYWNNEKQERV